MREKSHTPKYLLAFFSKKSPRQTIHTRQSIVYHFSQKKGPLRENSHTATKSFTHYFVFSGKEIFINNINCHISQLNISCRKTPIFHKYFFLFFLVLCLFVFFLFVFVLLFVFSFSLLVLGHATMVCSQSTMEFSKGRMESP